MSSEQPQDAQQERQRSISNQQLFLIGLLGIVFVIVLVVAIIILTRPESPSQDISQVQQETVLSSTLIATLTPTRTITPTPRVTYTPKPSRTPTTEPTSTASPLPTLLPSPTPDFPSEHDDHYKLVLWTPELADQLIDLLEEYPETLSSFARGEKDQGYYAAFQYPLFAQREALLQFPTAPQAERWGWQMAYNFARTGDGSAGKVYTNLITQELNQGNTSINELHAWGLSQDPQLLIENYPLEAGDGQEKSYLISVTTGENGSSFFWLVEEGTGYSSHSLTSDFDFVHPNQIKSFTADLLGTGGQVVGIFPSKVYDSLNYSFPNVFSLLQQSPVELPFSLFSPPAIGPDFTNNWSPVEAGEGPGDLKFSDAVFPACPVTVEHFYDWNGNEFTFLEETYQVNPDPDLLSYCEAVVEHSTNVWGMEPTVQIMEDLLPLWPPDVTSTGKEYPEDALDEWRYRLSIYNALLGNQDQAINYAQTILDDPAFQDSRWIEPAEEFLDNYQTQRDIYRTCLAAQFCNPRLAFQSLLETIPAAGYPNLVEILKQSGVTVLSKGFFDFDNSGEPEQWMIIRHQTGVPLEFWIISPQGTNLEGVFVSTVETTSPRISLLDPVSEPPIVELGSKFTFNYIQMGPQGEPLIVITEPEVVFSVDRTAMELADLEEELLSGGDPVYIQEQLKVLKKSSYFTCSYLICPRFLYLYGLASELANDDRSAVSSYLDLWRQYPGHPFTLMARFKLGSTFIPTPTHTPTITVTPSPTIEGTITITPTPTSTSEGYPPPGYPPPELSPTDTPEGYPYPTP